MKTIIKILTLGILVAGIFGCSTEPQKVKTFEEVCERTADFAKSSLVQKQYNWNAKVDQLIKRVENQEFDSSKVENPYAIAKEKVVKEGLEPPTIITQDILDYGEALVIQLAAEGFEKMKKERIDELEKKRTYIEPFLKDDMVKVFNKEKEEASFQDFMSTPSVDLYLLIKK